MNMSAVWRWMAVAAALASRADQPNVLVFLADDVGWGDIRCYNDVPGATMQTPRIDALARAGMRFTDAHSRALCAPSRYSILTGNYPFRSPGISWVVSAASSVGPGQKTMAEFFQEMGYETAFIGKWHMGGQLQGMDGQPIPPTYALDWRQVDWHRPLHRGPTRIGFGYSFFTHSGVQGDPFFYFENDAMEGDPERIVTWTKGVHQNKANAFQTKIEEAGFGLPEWDSTTTGERFTHKALDFIDRHAADGTGRPFFMHFCTQCIHTPMTPGEFMGTRVAGKTGSAHTDMLLEMDLQLGALLDRLEKHGLLHNTIVVFTSDNGPWENLSPESYDSSAHFRGRKGEAYEAGHRVPFIIRWDGRITPGSTCGKLIDHVDLLPSFATLLGGSLGPGHALDGIDVSPYFLGDESRTLRDFHFARGRAPEGTMKDFSASEFSYRRHGFKILATCQNRRPGDVFEMYRLETDPSETENLAENPEFAPMKEKLLKELQTLLRSKRSTPAHANDKQGKPRFP